MSLGREGETTHQTTGGTSHSPGLCHLLGKSTPFSSQQMLYLGILLDSASVTTVCFDTASGAHCVSLGVCHPCRTVTGQTIMQLLGLMAAAHPVVPLGLLCMRRLQRWFTCLKWTQCATKVAYHPCVSQGQLGPLDRPPHPDKGGPDGLRPTLWETSGQSPQPAT